MEDEFHIACVCPEYNRARVELTSQLGPAAAFNSYSDLLSSMAGSESSSTQALGKFLARARQTRRGLKLRLENLSSTLEAKSFVGKRAAWRLRGKPCCRHGVMFQSMPDNGCKCMEANSTPEDWAAARFMPALSEDLKAIIFIPFQRERFIRLGLLQSRARSQGW